MAGHMSSAIVGSNYSRCRSFEVAFTAASTAEAAIARGSYEMVATEDCYVRFGATGMSAAAALPSSQPAASAPVALIRLSADRPVPLDIDNDATYFRVIRVSADGTLTFNGPLAPSTNG